VDTLRTFIAIELPANVRAKIADHINRLRRECPDVRASWSREDNLHLTLKFLGDVPRERIPALSSAVEQAVQHMHPFDLIVKDCGAFPPHGRPKVLWIGISSEASSAVLLDSAFRNPQSAISDPASSLPPSSLALSSLHNALEDHCAAAGFEPEPRAFHPHLTIVRLREAKRSRAFAQLHKELGFAPQMFTVSELVLFRSELSSQGSKHIALSRHELG